MPNLTIKTDKKPTFWNEDIWMGAAFGMPIGLPFIGAIVGGFLGKNRMKSEAQYGKEVHTPTRWNKGILIGFMKGVAKGALALAGTAIAAGVLSALAPAAVAGSVFYGALGVGALVSAVTAIRGPFKGSKDKFREMEGNYQQALAEEQTRSTSMGMGRGQQMSGIAQGVGMDNGINYRNDFGANELARRNGPQTNYRGA